MSFSVSDPQPLLDAARFDDAGLVATVAQDDATGDVLMLAYMNRDTLRQTLETGVMTYWSRSRQKVWVKGETSGHIQQVKSIATDCDKDTLLVKDEQTGAACHDGYYSCFYREYQPAKVWKVFGRKVFEPEQVYG